MARIKIGGVKYVLHPDNLRRYDGYYLDGDITDIAPLDTYVIGYVVDDKLKIAICKKYHKHLYPILYGGIGIGAVVVICMCVIAFNPRIEVPHWTPTAREDVVGELEWGDVRTNTKFAYNQYATYDGEFVNLYVDSKDKVDIAVKVGELCSEFLPVTNKVPMGVDMEPQEIREAKLLVRSGDSVEEYPLVIERFNTVQIELRQGTDEDYQRGLDEAAIAQEANRPKDESSADDRNWNNYVEEDTDFASFPVITYKDPDTSYLDGED